MGQSLFKKHSKFQNFNEIFYCDMTRLRNTNLDIFIHCQHTKTILRKKIWDRVCLRNTQNFKNSLKYFTVE